jgi:hypothetical protein
VRDYGFISQLSAGGFEEALPFVVRVSGVPINASGRWHICPFLRFFHRRRISAVFKEIEKQSAKELMHWAVLSMGIPFTDLWHKEDMQCAFQIEARKKVMDLGDIFSRRTIPCALARSSP